MIKKISDNIFCFTFQHFGSNVYLIRDKSILIDTTAPENKDELISYLEEFDLKPSEIKKVILTHNHWDHNGNINLFKESKIYGHKKDFEEDNIIDIFEFNDSNFEIFHTPGHTPGSICLLYKPDKILFSGDTLFHNGIGRSDFPESNPTEMSKSLEKLGKLDYDFLCAGH